MKSLTKILLASLLFIGISITVILALFGHQNIPLDELKANYGQPLSLFIEVENMNVHYRDEGNSQDTVPIVLIHGTGSSLHTFDDWTEDLKADYRVIRMDLPGYGLTGPFPDRDYTIHHYADFIHQFLTTLGVEQCIIGGNSLGGRIAWTYTAKYSEMVDKLVLIDASGYPFKPESIPIAFELATIPVMKNIFTFITPRSVAKESIENVYADKSKVTEELVDRYFELTLREGNRQAFVDRLNMELDTTFYRQIKQIQQPTMIMWGDQDRLIPLENAYRFQEDLPNDTLVILPDVGHVPMEESPATSLAVLAAFLAD